MEGMLNKQPGWVCVSSASLGVVPMLYLSIKKLKSFTQKRRDLTKKWLKRIEKEGIEAWFEIERRVVWALIAENTARYTDT